MCEDRTLRRSQIEQASLASATKPINAPTLGLRASVRYLRMKHDHAFVMPAQPAPGERRTSTSKSQYEPVTRRIHQIVMDDVTIHELAFGM